MERQNVKAAVDELLRTSPEISSGELARRLGVTRQTAHAHLARLVRDSVLERSGAGRGARYRRAPQVIAQGRWPRRAITEDEAWRQVSGNAEIRSLRENARAIVHYAFTEMVNNAIDHSAGTAVGVRLVRSGTGLGAEVTDDGIGIFRHVMKKRALRSPFEAIAELQKGKVTTMPEAHSGEGIFFTSKAVDLLVIESGTTRWTVDNARRDQAVEVAPRRSGTRVRFEVERDTKRTLRQVFDAFTGEDLRFDRTRTVVRLFREGDHIMSRSEAKRLLAGLEKFDEVTLDFAGVRGIGQGFADEIFRVWQAAHPETRLLPVNANAAVQFMIGRAIAGGQGRPDGGPT